MEPQIGRESLSPAEKQIEELLRPMMVRAVQLARDETGSDEAQRELTDMAEEQLAILGDEEIRKLVPLIMAHLAVSLSSNIATQLKEKKMRGIAELIIEAFQQKRDDD